MIYRTEGWTADGGGFLPRQARTVAIYADGGSIGANPSTIGGTWAWVAVDDGGWMIHSECGWFEPPTEREGGRTLFEGGGVPTSGNNQSEFLAMLLAISTLKAHDPSWAGPAYTDSDLTIKRWTREAKLGGIPFVWRSLMGELLRMPGGVGDPSRWALLDGHPNKAQLASGIGKRG